MRGENSDCLPTQEYVLPELSIPPDTRLALGQDALKHVVPAGVRAGGGDGGHDGPGPVPPPRGLVGLHMPNLRGTARGVVLQTVIKL